MDLNAEALIRPVSLDAAENALHFIARCERAGLPELAAPARVTLARESAMRADTRGDLTFSPQSAQF